MAIRSALLAAAAISAPVSAATPIGTPDFLPSAPYQPAPALEIMSIISLRHSAELNALRNEGLTILKADGGTLSAVHRAELQTRLDRLEGSYRRQLELYDPWAVDSMGMRKY